LKPNKI